MPPAAAYAISPVRCASTEAVAQGFEVRACIEGRFDDSNGKVFLDKEERPELTVIAGGATIVPGLDDEIMGMKVGGKRTLLVPQSLAPPGVTRPRACRSPTRWS